MKFVVFAAVGLLVGLLGGTGVAAFKVRGQLLEAYAQALTDSTAAARASDRTAPGASSGTRAAEDAAQTGGSSVADSASAQASDGSVRVAARPGSASGAPAGAAGAAGAAGTPDSTGATPDSAAVPAADGKQAALPISVEGARKLAKIFSAMKPADAAKVLSKMSDDEVKAILLYMDARQAGQVVGSFEPTRAATLSRIVLQGQATDTAQVGGA